MDMSSDTTLQSIIERGPTGLTPWSVEQAAELGAYLIRGLIFGRREELGDSVGRALSVALVVHLGERGALAGAALAEATEAVLTALGQDAEPEDAMGVGLITYREAVERLREEQRGASQQAALRRMESLP